MKVINWIWNNIAWLMSIVLLVMCCLNMFVNKNMEVALLDFVGAWGCLILYGEMHIMRELKKLYPSEE